MLRGGFDPDPGLCVCTECAAEQAFWCSEVHGWSDADPPPWNVRPRGVGGGWEGGQISCLEFFLQPVRLPPTAKLSASPDSRHVALRVAGSACARSVLHWEISSLFGFRTLQALPF